MPNLETSLIRKDLGHLQIVAELWGIPLIAPNAKSALPILIEQMLSPPNLQKTIANLPKESLKALTIIQHQGGRMNWSLFTRRFGEIREMGPARRDREQPYKRPISAAETLWYHALIARAFFDTPSGPEEFVYIPDDIYSNLSTLLPTDTSRKTNTIYGRPATPGERGTIIKANDYILDHACTMLAALRSKTKDPEISIPIPFIKAVLREANILDDSDTPNPEKTKVFLTQSRAKALLFLVKTWLESNTINDLNMTPNLKLEGETQNNPLDTRLFFAGLLKEIPINTWWSLSSFISAVKQLNPDFQRTAGEYDSWFVRDTATGNFLQGFQNWENVEGALIRYLITGPFHWLGFLDLATVAQSQPNKGENRTNPTDKPISAFRLSQWALDLLSNQLPKGLPEEKLPIHVSSDGLISIPRLTSRAARYQIARFCHFEEIKNDAYQYRFSPASLRRAQDQGLQIEQLLGLLHRHAHSIPPNVTKAIKHWEAKGIAAKVLYKTILRLPSPEALKKLQASRASRFLEEPFNNTTIAIKRGAEKKVLAVLFELGYLGEIESIEEED